MNPVLIFRWIAFLLAAVFCLRVVFLSDYAGGVGPFRYLTIWALFMSFWSVSRLIAQHEGRTARRWDGLIAATAVMNTMVVFLYWRLYFADPLSVTDDGELGAWDMELYLHGLGPAIQIFDALFLRRAFGAVGEAVIWLTGTIAVYLTWSELVVSALHAKPLGTVTSGLPYPFLNNMEIGERAMFYGVNFVIAFIFLSVFVAIAWLIKRFRF